MIDETLNVKMAIDALRDVTEQIGLLLKTADGLMENHGWEIRRGNCISGNTGITAAFDWIPGFFLRTYSNNEYPKIAAYVCVIMSAPRKTDLKYVTAPLISACWVHWGGLEKVNSELQAGWAPAHIWSKDRRDDGSVVKCNVEKQWPKELKSGVTEFYSLALPLKDITSEGELDSRIIQPFVAGVEKYHGGTKEPMMS